MKTLVVIAALALASLSVGRTEATEGRVSDDAPASPDARRASTYTGAPVDAKVPRASGQVHNSKTFGQPTLARSATPVKPKRAPAVSRSQRFADFNVREVRSVLIRDRDGDHHASEFRIRFDVDTVFDHTEVYAELFLRRIGDHEWTLYHRTHDFEVYGSSDSDDYFVTTTLDDGFPTGFYDVLIDIYEVGHEGIVASVGPLDAGALGDLPLEEAGLDVPAQLPGYAIGGVRTTLILDDDGDGYYSRFAIDFDPDADFDGSYVYAVVWVRAQGGEWIEEHVSEDFRVDAIGARDAFGFTVDWLSGYPTAYYDVQIDLHDAATSLLVASAGSERPELSRVPLEDAERDRRVSAPATTVSTSTTVNVSSNEGGGGSLNLWMLLCMLPLLVARRRPAQARSSPARSNEVNY